MTRQAGLPGYEALQGLPDLVARAVECTRRLGYDKACIPEVGCLLHLLVSTRRGIRVGETGTACGVGAAWIVSALDPASTLTTVELEPERSAAAAHLFAGIPNVRTLNGDWSLIRDHAPFDVLFVDGGPLKSDCDVLLGLVALGGLLIFDDLTPPHAWTEDQRRRFADGDPVRSAWRDRPDCVCLEVMLTPASSVLLVTRVDANRNATGKSGQEAAD